MRQTNIDHDTAKRTRPEPRGLLRIVVVALAISLSVLEFGASLSMGAGPSSQSQDMQLQVTQCSNGDPSSCDQSTETVTQQPKKPAEHTVTVTPVQQQPAPAQEVHVYSLKTGKGSVQTSDGKQAADTIKVDPSLKEPGDNQPAVAPPGPAPTVTTQGGSAYSGFNFVSRDQALSQFAIPPFLMPMYASAGRAYGIPWNVLAAINSIETNYGRNTNVSSAGALGWMQFMPGTWKKWGVDASGDGFADPYNPVDAIYATARYLRQSGGGSDLPHAIFAYNHAKWYVDEVLKTASVYGSLPPGLVGETSTLAFGHFPLHGQVSYGDDFRADQLAGRQPRGLLIHGSPAATAVATQAVTVERVLLKRPAAKTLAHQKRLPAAAIDRTPDPAPPAVILPSPKLLAEGALLAQMITGKPVALPLAKAVAALAAKPRTAVAPVQHKRQRNGLPHGYGVTRSQGMTVVVSDSSGDRYSYGGLAKLRPGIRPGAQLRGGQAIGKLAGDKQATLVFAIRAAGSAAIDPRPLVDGYRLQEATDFYHAVAPYGSNPFVPSGGSGSLARGHYVFPIPSGVRWTPGRVDMGWDLETGTAGVGQPLLAVGDAQILHIQDMGGFGPTWITYRLLDGAAAGRTVFIGHAGPPMVKPGQVVRAGQPIIHIHGGTYGGPPGHFEIGWANPDGTNTLAAPHYSEGDLTPEGASFQSFISRVPGTFVDAVFPGGYQTLKPEKVSSKQELKLSQRLDRIANPRINPKPSSAAIRVARTAAPKVLPTKALSVQVTTAGARLGALSVPAGARVEETYALGTVDGAARAGWAAHQVVLLRGRGGAWTLIGPPLDATGKVRNPALRALATTRGGYGYAVGDKGSVVELRGTRSPLVEPAQTKADLLAVTAERTHRQLSGYAVGRRGQSLRLAGADAQSERVAPHVTLSAVALDANGQPTATGAFTNGDPALFRRDGSWQRLPARFGLPDGTSVRLTSLALGDGELWVAGGITDNPGLTDAPERPFAAHTTGASWTTYCSGSPALAAIVELGAPSNGACDRSLGLTPGDRGAAGSVAITDAGVVLSTAAGLQLLTSQNFRPVSAPSGITRSDAANRVAGALGLQSTGDGYLLGADGRLARIAPKESGSDSSTARTEGLPWDTGGKPGTVAVAPGGDRALALSPDGDAAQLIQGDWQAAPKLGIGLRDVAFAAPGKAWAIDAATGSLLSFDGKQWSVPGSNWADRFVHMATLESLGATNVKPGGQSDVLAGLEALAFRSSTDGYAVGDNGLLAHWDGGSWHVELPVSSNNLRTVAAGPGGVIAAGDDGMLLERSDGRWAKSTEAEALAHGQSFTATSALADGTMLAVAGGTVLMKEPSSDWKLAPVQPFGQPVAKITGYRDSAGGLNVLALAGPADAQTVLDADRNGWHTISDPGGADVATFGSDPRARQVLVADSGGWAAFANLKAQAAPTASPDTPAAATQLADTIAGDVAAVAGP